MTYFLHLERKPTQGQRTSVAAIISDSKGNYLKQQVVRVEDRAIYWCCQADIDDNTGINGRDKGEGTDGAPVFSGRI
jgi:hypothetical protein